MTRHAGGRPRVTGPGSMAHHRGPGRKKGTALPGPGGARALVTPPEEFAAVPRPACIPQGAPRGCYPNALMLSYGFPEFRYAEGWALLPRSPGLWIHHAWVVDPDGNAIDSTWAEPGSRYVGITACTQDILDRLPRGKGGLVSQPVLATRNDVITGEDQMAWDLAGWFTRDRAAGFRENRSRPELEP